MSATIDGGRFAGLLGADVPVIESEGKAWPLAIRWLGAAPDKRTDEAMAGAILTAWREQEGDILAFLPGVGEIERVRERLAERLSAALVLPLHGQCEPAAQRAAIRRDPDGRRRIVLATSIAETSLTLDGVRVVVDSGLSRRPEFDKAAGVTRLITTRASQASAAQRGPRRASGPGVAYRLWEEAAHAGRPAYDPPEILTSDLAPLSLSLAQWGRGRAGDGLDRSAACRRHGGRAGKADIAGRSGGRADHRSWPRHGRLADGAGAGAYVALCRGAWGIGGRCTAGLAASGTRAGRAGRGFAGAHGPMAP
jgi:ATP-dependent helicase HrpB